MSCERPVQLGLCCMNTTLKKQKPPVYASRRIIVRIIDERGIEELKKRQSSDTKDFFKINKLFIIFTASFFDLTNIEISFN